MHEALYIVLSDNEVGRVQVNSKTNGWNFGKVQDTDDIVTTEN